MEPTENPVSAEDNELRRDSLATDNRPNDSRQLAVELVSSLNILARDCGLLVGKKLSTVESDGRCVQHTYEVIEAAQWLMTLVLEDVCPDTEAIPPVWSDEVLVKVLFLHLTGYFVCRPTPRHQLHFRFVTTSDNPDTQELLDLLQTTKIWAKILSEREQADHPLTMMEVEDAIKVYLQFCIAFRTHAPRAP